MVMKLYLGARANAVTNAGLQILGAQTVWVCPRTDTILANSLHHRAQKGWVKVNIDQSGFALKQLS